MAEILPRHYLIAIIGFVFFSLTSLYLINSMVEDKADYLNVNEVDEFEKFNESFNRLDDINESVSAIQSSIQNAKTNFGIFGVLNSLINSAWNALRLLFSSLDFMNSTFNALTTTFGVPGYVPILIGLFFAIIIGFGIFKMIFKADV